MECPFCNLESKESERIVLESERCFFLQQPQKVLIGSGVIVPKEHRETAFDLTPEEWQDTFSLLQDAKDLIDRRCEPDGYNLGWNSGAVAGQEIFHVHLHLIPRYKDEPLAGKGIRYWLKQPGNKRA